MYPLASERELLTVMRLVGYSIKICPSGIGDSLSGQIVVYSIDHMHCYSSALCLTGSSRAYTSISGQGLDSTYRVEMT
jgi:hypothetical protein